MSISSTLTSENPTVSKLIQKTDFGTNFGRWRDIGGMWGDDQITHHPHNNYNKC